MLADLHIESNPGLVSSFLTSLLLALRIGLPAMAWGWLLPAPEKHSGSAFRRLLHETALVSLAGLLLQLSMVLVLAHLGLYSVWIEGAVLCGITITGLVCGKRRTAESKGRFLPAFCLLLLVCAGAMTVPGRSEWIRGGWDPGIYTNQGAMVARTGTFYPAPDPALAELSEQERLLFTRGDDQYRECYPGVAVDMKNGSIQHYFFRLMPSYTALLARTGGLEMTYRCNLLLGGLLLLSLGAVIYLHFGMKFFAFSACLLLLCHPLFLYHLHFPTTELLHLYLLVCLLFIMPYRCSGRTGPALICLLLFFLLLNRVSFTSFAGWFLLLFSWLDRTREDRKRVLTERLWMIAAVIAGVLFDYTICAVTMLRLHHITGTMLTALVVLSAAAIAIDLWHTSRGTMRRKMLYLPGWLTYAGLALLFLYLSAVYFDWNVFPFLPHPHKGLVQIIPYLGPGLVVFSLIGAFLLAGAQKTTPSAASCAICLFAFPALVLLMNDHIAGVYPWATRRMVPYMLPLLVLLAGYGLERVFRLSWQGRPVGAIVAVTVLVGILVSLAGESKKDDGYDQDFRPYGCNHGTVYCRDRAGR